ncbi:MAG: hypothetical protein K2Y22_10730 [Candidatus Obscuribacterales bacterium]|nr:hypothetical protein [Candidatus Obscuribacterales bacterium]
MDPTLAHAGASSSVLDVFVAVSVAVLAFIGCMLFFCISQLTAQANRTLTAYERLADTLDREVVPTVVEVREVMDGIKRLPNVTAARLTEVTHQVENVAGSVGEAAGQAKKHSSVFGAGLFAGLKAYLSGNDDDDIDYPAKQLSEARGETNVKLK